MTNEKKETVRFWVWLAFVVVVTLGIFVFESRTGRFDVGPAAGAATSTEQTIADAAEGYSFAIPISWYFEKSSSSSFSVYPDYLPAASSSTAPVAPPLCKIEVSIFPYDSAIAPGDWITGRLAADPTLDVVERSSGQVALGDSTGIEWNGAIDGIPTTLVYAFTTDKAYEIAPSTLIETSTDENCGDALGIFLQKLNI